MRRYADEVSRPAPHVYKPGKPGHDGRATRGAQTAAACRRRPLGRAGCRDGASASRVDPGRVSPPAPCPRQQGAAGCRPCVITDTEREELLDGGGLIGRSRARPVDASTRPGVLSPWGVASPGCRPCHVRMLCRLRRRLQRARVLRLRSAGRVCAEPGRVCAEPGRGCAGPGRGCAGNNVGTCVVVDMSAALRHAGPSRAGPSQAPKSALAKRPSRL